MADLNLPEEQQGTLAQLIADGIAAGMAKLIPRKTTLGQYIAQHRRKVKLKVMVYQNSIFVHEAQLTEEEVGYLNAIHRPGRYINRKVEVLVAKHADDPVEIDIRYADATTDQRLDNARHWRTFGDLVKQIVDEQSVAEENELEAVTRPRR